MSGKMTKFKDLLVDTPNRYTVNGEVKTIVFAPNAITQEGTKDKAEYFNEMQKNGLYNVNATRVVEGTVEFYDIVIEGSDIFDVFDTQFIINFNETNTKLNPILRFNSNNYYIRALEGFIDIGVQVGSLQKTYIGFLDSLNNKLKLMNYERKLTFDTVADLQTATGLVAGDTIQLLGYYSKNDGAGHYRKISVTDDGSGIAVGSLLANIIHNGVIDISWFGIDDNSIIDKSIFINKAIQYFENQSKKGTIIFPNKTYKINSIVNIKREYVSLKGNATFDCSDVVGTAFKITSTSQLEAYKKRAEIEGNFTFFGGGKEGTQTFLEFDSTVKLSISSINLKGISAYNFKKGIVFKNVAHNITGYNCNIWGCGTILEMPHGFYDYGERISFIGSTFFNSDLAVKNANSNGAFHFLDCSFDYNVKQFELTGGRVILDSCHVEANSYSSEPITLSGNGTSFVMSGGWLLCAGTNTSSITKVNTTSGQGGGAIFDKVSMNNLGSSVKYFSTGNGRISLKNIFSYDIRNNPLFISAYYNYLKELETPYIYACINNDTQPIIDRYNGTNIYLKESTDVFYNGTKSLTVKKIYGSGSLSSFRIAIPLGKSEQIAFEFYWKKLLNTASGSFYVSFRYAMKTTLGIETALREVTLGDITKTITNAETDWEKISVGQPVILAPSWATHLVVEINLFGMTTGDLYFDGFDVSLY